MRVLMFIFSILLLVSSSWGFENKSKTRKDALAHSESVTSTDSSNIEKPANESNLILSLRATGYESVYAKADILLFKLNYFLKYYVNPSVYLRLNPIVRLHSGHVQSVEGAETLENRISVQHAAGYYQWMKESYLSMGIFDQFEIFSPLLVDDRMAFVAGQVKQSVVSGAWTFSLLGQSAIPNTQSYLSNQNEKEATPMLNMVGVSSNWNVNDKNYVQAKASYFKFSDIPLSVSSASVINGNTSAEARISDTERAFKYEYQGIDSDISFKRRVYKGAYLLGAGSFIENQGASSGVNQAYRYGGGAGMTVLPNRDIELSGYTYRIESDATIGAYGNTDYFITNHAGYEIVASWKNTKQKYRISFYYNDGRLIVENSAQSNDKLYFLRFEVFNVSI